MTEDEFRTHMLLLGLRTRIRVDSLDSSSVVCVDSPTLPGGEWAVCVFSCHSSAVDWDKLHTKVHRHLHERGIEK